MNKTFPSLKSKISCIPDTADGLINASRHQFDVPNPKSSDVGTFTLSSVPSNNIDPVQNILQMLSGGAYTNDAGVNKSTGIPINTNDENDFRLLFHVPGNPRITMNSILQYVPGQSNQTALVENVDYQVLRAVPLTIAESTEVEPTLTFSS